MPEIAVEKIALKPVILEVLNDLFNISDLEEAKRTPVGRMISIEAKVERLTNEVQTLERSLRADYNALRTETKGIESSLRAEMKALDSSLRAEMKALDGSLRAEMKVLEKTTDAKFDKLSAQLELLNSHLAFHDKLLYLVLASIVAGVIKIIFFS